MNWERVEVASPWIDSETETQFRAMLEAALERYDRLHLSASLASCVIELASNAGKANLKRVFFEEQNWDIHDSGTYTDRLRKFKEGVLRKEWMLEYIGKAAERGLHIRIVLAHCEDGLKIEVINNLPILAQDERRLREKFQNAMQCETLFEFYRKHQLDDSEGEGLGLAMSVLLLKSESLPASLLRVGSHGNETIARVEIPFTDRFQPTRN